MSSRDREEMIALAGEYALGVMRAEDKSAFEAEMQRNHELVAAVAFWHDRLLEVTPEPAPVEPATDLWKRIERDLSGKAIHRRSASFWNSLFFWRVSGMIGIAASVMLALRLLVASPGPDAVQYLTVLQAPGTSADWLVEIDLKTLRLQSLSAVAAGPGKALQFWTKPDGVANPTSLGLVPADRPTEILLSKLPGVGSNQLFEVTLEPQTGSPINRPTGPILAVGKAVRL